MKHEEDPLNELMPLSKVKIPVDNFEDRVMSHIKLIEAKKAGVYKTKLYSIIFFLAALIFGFMLTHWLTHIMVASNISATFKQLLQLFSQIIYVALIVVFSNKIFALIKTRRYLNESVQASHNQEI